jgi:predicted AAA+ superfamily ATPase
MEPTKINLSRFNYYRMLNELEIADWKLGKTNKKGIILCGPSRVGKTTLLYYLLSKELKHT